MRLSPLQNHGPLKASLTIVTQTLYMVQGYLHTPILGKILGPTVSTQLSHPPISEYLAFCIITTKTMLSSKKRDQKNDHFWAYSGWEALEKAMSSSNSRLSIMVNQPALFSKSSLHPNSLIEPATAAAARGYAVIKREMQLTDNEANPSILRDIGFSTLVCLAVSRHSTEDKRSEHLKLILDGLKWRLQMQERFALVWQEMVKHGLLSMECVMRRIDLGAATGSDTVLALINTIERFEYVQDPGNGPRSRSERIPKDSL